MTYKEFLEITGQISEEDFDKVTKSLPEISSKEFKDTFDSCWWDDHPNSPESLAKEISDTVIRRYTEHAYTDDVDLETNKIYIGDIESLEELKKLNEVFSKKGWKIADYDYLEKELTEAEENMKEEDIRMKYIQTIHNLPTSKLKDIVKNL